MSKNGTEISLGYPFKDYLNYYLARHIYIYIYIYIYTYIFFFFADPQHCFQWQAKCFHFISNVLYLTCLPWARECRIWRGERLVGSHYRKYSTEARRNISTHLHKFNVDCYRQQNLTVVITVETYLVFFLGSISG